MKVKGRDLKAGTIMMTNEEVLSAAAVKGRLQVTLQNPKTGRKRHADWGLNSTLFVKSVPTKNTP
jgi:hypothetical protein